jgi:hypothetical protein
MRVLEWLLCRSKEMKGGEHCSSLSRRNGEEGGSDSVRHVGLEVPSGEHRGGGGASRASDGDVTCMGVLATEPIDN